ncbi:hypothetical protein PHMEG_0007572 [Phytophthora megakarya]|uniref:GAG-pre-integrase domain-containing protein n=1 Tax=Phytophthora megakarya TaxID=4795 RepID=A0A225WKV2_9STRA|nr:hypothetical protein PHMEG_0007572 [Phytophthora megakarya]
MAVSKLAEKDVVAQFSKAKCVFRYSDATVASTSRKGPWAVAHARLGHIPFKRYLQLSTMAEGVLRITDDGLFDHVCAGCFMGKMRADDFPKYPEKLVKSEGVLHLLRSDVVGPVQMKAPDGCTFAVTVIDVIQR